MRLVPARVLLSSRAFRFDWAREKSMCTLIQRYPDCQGQNVWRTYMEADGRKSGELRSSP